VIIVEGQVEDTDVSTITLIANDQRFTVRVQNGRFKHAIPLLERSTRLVAEVTSPGEAPRQSQAVTVNNAATGSVSVLALDAATLAKGAKLEITASWRPRSDKLDDVVNGIQVKTFETSPDVEPSKFFFLRHTKPGVYNFVVRDPGNGAQTEVRGQIYHLVNGRLAVGELKPVSVGGTTSGVLVRMLFPQGVLWDQNDWFTGRSEGPETITKFRFPEGTSWIERKRDLR
jgi:hypothetical protein